MEGSTLDQLISKNFDEAQDITDDNFVDIETDIYFSLTKLLDRIQTHYTNNQPGLKEMMENMKNLIQKVDPELSNLLETKEVEYIQFSFRWMNCFLMREFPINLILRLWDTYFSEENSFRDFHFYVCSSLLLSFSKQLKKMTEFQEMILFLQKLPTNSWEEKDIEVLLAKSYQIREIYSNFFKKK